MSDRDICSNCGHTMASCRAIGECFDTPTPAASAGPDFEAAEKSARWYAAPNAAPHGEIRNLARAYLALRSLPREGEAPVDDRWLCECKWGDGWQPASVSRCPVCGVSRPAASPLPAPETGRHDALTYLRECVDAMREGRDADGQFSQKAYELIAELAAPPLPAGRGSEVSEEMVERGVQAVEDAEEDLELDTRVIVRAVLTAALGRGREGAV